MRNNVRNDLGYDMLLVWNEICLMEFVNKGYVKRKYILENVCTLSTTLELDVKSTVHVNDSFYTSTKLWRGYIFTAVSLCVCWIVQFYKTTKG